VVWSRMHLLSGSIVSILGVRSVLLDCLSEVELAQPDGSHLWPAAACFAIFLQASTEKLAKIQPSALEPPPPSAEELAPLVPTVLRYSLAL